MVKCPICDSEHKKLVNMCTHMILVAINRHDDHESYLDLLTGRDQSVWEHKNDAAVAELLRKYYRKLKRFPTFEELEDRENQRQESKG